jgi:hypothetical protein
VRPRGIREAIARSLGNEDRAFAATRWSDALSTLPRAGGDPAGGAGRLLDSRVVRVACGPEAAFAPIRRIGGRTGWYSASLLWRMRGWLDLLVGGVGMRRGRRDPEWLIPGDALDFWRVEAFEPPRLLRLAAEMKVPGRAWLQFEVAADGAGSLIRQTAIFDARGLGGRLYWYALYPAHQVVFRAMLRGIARSALTEKRSATG